MSNRFIDIEKFLEPWLEQVRAFDAALGRESEFVLEGSKLHEAASAVFNAAFTMPADSVAGEDLLDKAQWLLQMLSTSKSEDDYEALALLPVDFWETLAGRAIFRVMELVVRDDLLSAKEAAEKLGVTEVRLYHLAATKAIPYVLDFREKNNRRRRRFRVDYLKDIPYFKEGFDGGGDDK